MKVRMIGIALALALTLAGCAGPAKPAPADPPSKPPENSTPAPMPRVGDPKALPTTVGATLEAMGPGLVIQGHTSLPEIHVELRKGSTVLNQADVTPKDDGLWRITWNAPKESGTEVVVSPKGDPGKILVRGALPGEQLVSLFYSENFTATGVAVTDKTKRSIQISGQVRAAGGTFWAELRDHEKALATVPLTAGKTGAGFTAFSQGMQLPSGAHQVYLYTLAPDGTAKLDVIIPVIFR